MPTGDPHCPIHGFMPCRCSELADSHYFRPREEEVAIEQLRSELAQLRAEIAGLRRDVERLERELVDQGNQLGYSDPTAV